MRTKEFFKPTIGKIIISIILIIPSVIFTISVLFNRADIFPLFPLKFFILNLIIDLLKIFYFCLVIIFCGGWNLSCDVNSATILSFFILVLGSYFVSCLISIVWDSLFKHFKTKAKLYKIIILNVLLTLFFIFAILLPAIGQVTIKKSLLYAELSKEEAFSSSYDSPLKIQELTIKNELFLPVKYALPPVSVCVYDLEKKVAPRVYFVSYKDKSPITLGIKEEKKIYILKGLGIRDMELEIFEKYKNEIDELLVFESANCSKITEEDRNKAERIKLIN